MNAPEFHKDNRVIGKKLFEFVEWAKESEMFGLSSEARSKTPLVLPPIQRSAVWNAKQIIDLWDSVLRGLPIGMFYLLKRTDAGPFELLDGQQRLRALLLGFAEKTADDRCLWVDLAPTDSSSFRLFITSKTQPFGYDPATGRKWPTHDRRKAREHIEPDPKGHPILVLDDKGNHRLDEAKIPRSAYDSELFAGNVEQDGEKIAQPPKPYKSSDGCTFKLNDLLGAWRDDRLEALAKTAPGASEEAVAALNSGFKHLKATEVALLKIDLNALDGDDPELALFERVGAGGTPLSSEERLYSIYKYHKEGIRDLVDNICSSVGKILPATKIVTTALRIANARKEKPAYSIPEVSVFAKEMRSLESELCSNLQSLFNTDGAGGQQSLHQGFKVVKDMLSIPKSEEVKSEEVRALVGAFWMPDVLLATLPPGVWQVLVFWASSLPEGTQWNESRKEAVRFALFWRLCVWNDEKATVRCFEYLSDKWEKVFPATALYQILVSDGYARQLISAADFTAHFKGLSKTEVWRTDPDRFGEGPNRNEMCARWWWSGKSLLPWLQRDYIRTAFQDYVPLSDHEDDIPYDIDHICPANDWGAHETTFKNYRLEKEVKPQAWKNTRGLLGNGIGNFRLVGSAENRGDGDADLAKKMPFIEVGTSSDGFEGERIRWAFPPDPADIKLWMDVSRSGPVAERRWNNERLKAFQQAVENRTVYLYRCFHEHLEYSFWTSPGDQSEDAVNQNVLV